MHVIAWLLTQRAVLSGELSPSAALDPARRLIGPAEESAMVATSLPRKAQRLVDTSIDLSRRVARLDAAQGMTVPEESPARQMFQRLAMAF
jgi:regulator of CtrA degradation